MHVVAHGFDTVRSRYNVDALINFEDPTFKDEMLHAGWEHRTKSSFKPDDCTFLESSVYTFQHPENDTLRLMLYGTQGLTPRLVSEFSAPRLRDTSPLNTSLVPSSDLPGVLLTSQKLIQDVLPSAFTMTLDAFPRLDYAVDVAAQDAKSALISASSQFVIAGAKKTARQLFPGETGKCWSSRETFRGYCKGSEALAKLSPKQRKEHEQTLIQLKADGTVRLERASRIKSGYSPAFIPLASTDHARFLSDGFKGGVFRVGSLSTIREQLWDMDISPQRRNSLYTFASLYAELGEEQTRDYFTRATFFRRKKQFLESGLRFEDVTTYDREIDLTPVFHQLRAA